MEIIDSVILGALQGVTEFLPISSSGHLVLGEGLLGLNIGELKSFDVAVHMGTLLAIVLYFWKDIWGMLKALVKWDVAGPYGKLIMYILLGSVPAVILGFTAEDWIDGIFRNVGAVAVMMLIVGVVFLLGEYVAGKRKSGVVIGFRKAFVIGLAQACALIPGVSRSGSTIVAGLFQGVSREAAARFSFLLGLPVMAGAGLLTALKVEEVTVGFDVLGLGFVVSFVVGLGSVAFLMKFLKNHSLLVFAVYLLVLGISVLIFR
ncbi:undecaprenyl-diphosphatase UppP [Patescibacteria group bacterium]|nr:undecaprenyl-diphosphatase UppP [Patescibacteria group bacterium]